jgi:superfamily II DNA/RNA helicase
MAVPQPPSQKLKSIESQQNLLRILEQEHRGTVDYFISSVGCLAAVAQKRQNRNGRVEFFSMKFLPRLISTRIITSRSGLVFVGLVTMHCLLLLRRVSSSSSSSSSSSRHVSSIQCHQRSVAAFATAGSPNYRGVASSQQPQQHRRQQEVTFGRPRSSCDSYPRSLATCGNFLDSNSRSSTRRSVSSSSSSTSATEKEDAFFADQLSFAAIGIQSQVLLDRLEAQNLRHPTRVQASSFDSVRKGSGDVTIGAETGSGKTLAYLLPLLDDILQQKAKAAAAASADESGSTTTTTYDYARAVILVPNKELVQQVLRMALPLCGGVKQALVWGGGGLYDLDLQNNNDNGDDNGDTPPVDPTTVVRLAVLPGGLAEPLDFKPFRDSVALGGRDPPVDIVLSTPAAMGPLGLKPVNIGLFADIQTLVIDEADMLLDGGYIRALENVLMGFRRADRLDSSGGFGMVKTQHVFCAATLPDMGLRSVDAYLQRKFPYAKRIAMAGMHNARHYGLKEPTVWIEEDFKKERMERLVELLKTESATDETTTTATTTTTGGGLLNEKVMIFLNSVDDVNGATGALERAGLQAVPYHAKLSLEERSSNLDRFRRYSKDGTDKGDTISILICTDLASRGLDVPGVDAVVQLQFAGNVVAHLHRMGRCGRAGQRTGRGIVFYSSQERELVDVVRDAETQQERMVLEQDVDDLDEQQLARDEATKPGTVNDAFSRKRGFTKKLKKLRREATNQ